MPVLLWGLDPVQLLSHGGPHCTVPWALTPTSPAHCLPAGLILPRTRRASLLVAPSALSIDAGGRGHTVGMEKGNDLRVVSFPVTSESSPKPLLSALVYSVANWPADGAGFQLWPAARPASVGHRALAPWGPGAGGLQRHSPWPISKYGFSSSALQPSCGKSDLPGSLSGYFLKCYQHRSWLQPRARLSLSVNPVSAGSVTQLSCFKQAHNGKGRIYPEITRAAFSSSCLALQPASLTPPHFLLLLQLA